MADPVISVIIPVYNAEAYIRDCLEQVAAQLPGQVEAVVVDDVSTDGSAAIIHGLSESLDELSIRYVKQSENGGPSRARNAGLDHAKGEYITFVDADDRLAPNALSELLRAARRDQPDIVVGDLITFRDTDGGPSYRKYAGLEAQGVFAFDMSGPLEEVPRIVYAVSAYAKLFRRSFIEAHAMRFDESMRYAEDHRFIIPAYARAKKISVCPRVVYEYRKDNNESLMAKFHISYFDCIVKVVSNNIPVLSGWPQYYYTRRLLEYELLQNVERIGTMSREDAEHAFFSIRKAVMQLDQRTCRAFVREFKRLRTDYRHIRLGAFRTCWLRHRARNAYQTLSW